MWIEENEEENLLEENEFLIVADQLYIIVAVWLSQVQKRKDCEKSMAHWYS
jgi:uncharacterized protein YjfI (DUF2170 family)